MRRFLFLKSGLFIALIGAPLGLTAQEAPERVVSLEEFIRIVTASHPGFEEILIDQIKLKYQKAASLTSDDIRVSFLPEYSFSLTSNNTSSGAVSGSVQLSKLFRPTGTALTGNYGLSQTGGVFSSEFQITAVQPLIQNVLGAQYHLEEELADLVLKQSDILVAEAYEEYLAYLIGLYESWVASYSSRKSASNSLHLKLQLVKDVRARRASRIALNSDVLLAERQTLVSRTALNSADTEYENSLHQIRSALRVPVNERLAPDPASGIRTVLRDFQEEWTIVKTESRTYRLYQFLLSQSSNKALQAFQNILPAANLEAGYALKGNGIVPWENPGHNFSIGLNLSFPIGGTKENAQLETARLNERQQKIANENKGVFLEQNLYRLFIRIRSAEERYRIAGERLGLSRKLVQEQGKRFQQGVISLSDYLNALDYRDQDEQSIVSLQVELNNLSLDWLRLTDRLVEKDRAGVFKTKVR